MSSVDSVPRELLMVRKDQTLQDLHNQAQQILGHCISYKNDGSAVINCTMHTPSFEQLEDLQAAALTTGKVAVLVGGQLGLMTQIIPLLNEEGFYVAEAITDRISKEIVQEDGTTKKVSYFNHQGLRQLGYL